MFRNRSLRCLAFAALLVVGACRANFDPRQFGNDHGRLYQAAHTYLQNENWDNAIEGFERLGPWF